MADLRLILVQHGLAETPDEGGEPELTALGRAEVRRMARCAMASGVSAQRLLHSGKLRAAQTADIFSAALHPSRSVDVVAGLAPKDDPGPIGELLEGEHGELLIVGHLPHLAGLAGLLLAGDAAARPIAFRNAGMVCIERVEDVWSLRWAMVPELL